MLQADNSVKNWRNFPISNSLQYLCTHKVWWKSIAFLLKLSSRDEKWGTYLGQINAVKKWRNMPIKNPKPDLHNINAHAQVWWKIHWHLLMLSSVNENTDGWTYWRTDTRTANVIPTSVGRGYQKWNDNTPPLSCKGRGGRADNSIKHDLHNIKTYPEFDKYPLIFSPYCPETSIWTVSDRYLCQKLTKLAY